VGPKVNNYKDLIVWQKAILMVKSVYEISASFPDSEKFGLVQQVRRAAVSIPSNIAEGWGRKSSGSFSQFLKIAKGSLCEVETQLIIAVELNFIEEEKIKEINNLSEEISRMIRSLVDTLESTKV
jgi:four helix bundle protein